MRLERKKTIRLIAIGVILVLAILFILLRSDGDAGPSYGGRSLSEWVGQIETTSSHNDRSSPTFLQTSNAIVHIGTNGAPYLLEWISYEPSRPYVVFWSAIIRGMDMLPSSMVPDPVSRWVGKSDRLRRATSSLEAFSILGETASSSVDELYAIVTNSSQLRISGPATYAITYLGPTAYPVVLEIASDTNAPTRRIALGGLRNMGNNAILAIPLLLRALNDPDTDISSTASFVLGDLALAPEIAVPALISALKHPFILTRIGASVSLSKFGTNAVSALPALQAALGDPDDYVRSEISNALQIITSVSIATNIVE